MATTSLVHPYQNPPSVEDVTLSPNGAKITFTDGTSTYSQGAGSIDVSGTDIMVYDSVRNRTFYIDYTSGTLSKFTSSTPEELVEYWLQRKFFFF